MKFQHYKGSLKVGSDDSKVQPLPPITEFAFTVLEVDAIKTVLELPTHSIDLLLLHNETKSMLIGDRWSRFMALSFIICIGGMP